MKRKRNRCAIRPTNSYQIPFLSSDLGTWECKGSWHEDTLLYQQQAVVPSMKCGGSRTGVSLQI